MRYREWVKKIEKKRRVGIKEIEKRAVRKKEAGRKNEQYRRYEERKIDQEREKEERDRRQ